MHPGKSDLKCAWYFHTDSGQHTVGSAPESDDWFLLFSAYNGFQADTS